MRLSYFIKNLVILFSVFGLGACTFLSPNLDKNANLDSTKAVVVMGLSPAGTKVHFNYGKIESGQFLLEDSAFIAQEQNGYIVQEINSNTWIGLFYVRVIDQFGKTISFYACDSSNSMVFKADPDEIIYIGDLSLTREGFRNLAISEEKLKKYLNVNYPKLSDKAKTVKVRWLSTNRSCLQAVPR